MPESSEVFVNNEHSVSLKDYLDAQLAEMRRAVTTAVSAAALEGVPLKQFFEAILDEQRRGMAVAEQEREKSAGALLHHLEAIIDQGDTHIKETMKATMEESRRGLSVAEQEREKAASALRDHLEQTITEGDRNLREHIKTQVDQLHNMRLGLERSMAEGDANLKVHIESQIGQIAAALDAASILERQRYTELKEKIEASTLQSHERLLAVQREIQLIQEASTNAVSKAEGANEKRFASVNEFRAQLSSQASTFLLREVADSQFADLRRALQELSDKVNKVV